MTYPWRSKKVKRHAASANNRLESWCDVRHGQTAVTDSVHFSVESSCTLSCAAIYSPSSAAQLSATPHTTHAHLTTNCAVFSQPFDFKQHRQFDIKTLSFQLESRYVPKLAKGLFAWQRNNRRAKRSGQRGKISLKISAPRARTQSQELLLGERVLAAEAKKAGIASEVNLLTPLKPFERH